jgi:hypothetical protein
MLPQKKNPPPVPAIDEHIEHDIHINNKIIIIICDLYI